MQRLFSATGLSIQGVMYFLDWTCGLDSLTELEIVLNTNPGIHFFQHWKHYYLLIKFILTSYKGSVCTNTLMIQVYW